MKKKTLLSSIIAIIVCASIMCGSTFALFTSESKVNVAVSSASVKVTATVSDPLLDSELGSNLPETTATLSDNKVTVTNMVPGDIVSFKISVFNESTVTVKYRACFEVTADSELADALEITANMGDGEKSLKGVDKKKTDWEVLTPGDATVAVKEIPITISLPQETDNLYQAKTLEFSFLVEAVQGNAYTGPEAIIERFAESALPDLENDVMIKLGGGSQWGIDWPVMPTQAEVEAAWTFTATDDATTVQESPYKDWICDFIIESSAPIAKGELGLMGKYNSWGNGEWLAFTNPLELADGQALPMLTSTLTRINGMAVTYEMICTDVIAFDCGVFRGLAGDQMSGKSITVSLVLIDTDYALGLIEDLVIGGMTEDAAMAEIMNIDEYFTYGENILVASKTTYNFD